MRKSLKDINLIYIILIFIVFFILFSCQNSSGVEIKRINLFSIGYNPSEIVNENEVYPKDFPGYIFYRKYYIYFFDGSTKTLYKFSRNGNSVLTIQNSSMTASGFGIDKEKLMSTLEESQRTIKINRSFPLPDVTGISVDFNDNIYFKVVIKGTSGDAKNDCSGFLSNFSDENHKIYYLLNDESSQNIDNDLSNFEKIMSKSNLNEGINTNFYTFFMVFNQYGDFIKVIALSKDHPSFPHNSSIYHTKENFEEGSNKDGKKLDGTNYIYFILPTLYENSGLPSALANTSSLAYIIRFSMNQSNDDNQILNLPKEISVNEENNASNVNNSNLNENKNVNEINANKTTDTGLISANQNSLNSNNKSDQSDKNQVNDQLNSSENMQQEKDNQNSQIYEFIYEYCQNSFYTFLRLSDLAVPEGDKEVLSSEFGNFIITPDGYTAVQVYYYGKGYIIYDSIYKIDFIKGKSKIRLDSYKRLFNEKSENGVQKITLTSSDTYIGSAEGKLIFYIRYLEKLPLPTAKLIIKSDKQDQLITRILKVKDILTTDNLVVGENGSIYGFSKIKKKIYFFYYASEVAVSKLKISN